MSTLAEDGEMAGALSDGQDDDEVGVEDMESVDLLIEAIKKRPALYDVGHDDFKHLSLRNSEWASVGAEIGKSALWCKSEWMKRRAAYVRKRKIIRQRKSAAQRKKLMMRDPYFFKLRFLDRTLVPGSWNSKENQALFAARKRAAARLASSGAAVNSEEYSADSRSDIDDDIADEQQPSPPEIKLGLGLGLSSLLNSHGTRSATTSNGVAKSKSLPRLFPSEASSPSFPRVENTETHDEYYHYCQSLAERMRKLDPEMSSYLMLKIDELVHDALYGNK